MPLHAANGSAAQVIVMLGGSIHDDVEMPTGFVARAQTVFRNVGCWLQRILWRL